jgi:hypothetical protein
MATIAICDLHPTGADLFNSSESYLQELSDIELSETNGGSSPLFFTIGLSIGLIFSGIIIVNHR